MVQKKNRVELFLEFIASKRFFYIVLSLFVFQTLWIALSNNYGSPHDEKYHVGLIQAYSHYVTPFISDQPAVYDTLGDITRNTSYLYHYIMSFPFRIISSITSDIATQVIFLRLFNIAFVIIGIIIFKKILDDLFKKPIISNLALFGFVMTPVVVYVSEGVNYDNLVFLGFAASLYLTLRLIKKFRLEEAVLWLSINIFTVLTKFSYAPVAVVLIFGTAIYYFVNRNKLVPAIRDSIKTVNKTILVLVSLLLIIGGGLLIERYVGNIITYGTPLPDCAKVLNADRCSKFGPWGRNVQLIQKNTNKHRDSIVGYTKYWVRTMESTSFGMYKSAITKDALPIIGFAGWLLLIAFLLAILTSLRFITKKPKLIIVLASMTLYVAALFYINYRDYRSLGSPVAVQGRYLIPMLPLMMAFSLLFIQKIIAKKEKLWMFAVTIWILLFLQGGLVTYIVRTDQVWWWRNSTVINANEAAQKILKPITFGS